MQTNRFKIKKSYVVCITGMAGKMAGTVRTVSQNTCDLSSTAAHTATHTFMRQHRYGKPNGPYMAEKNGLLLCKAEPRLTNLIHSETRFTT